MDIVPVIVIQTINIAAVAPPTAAVFIVAARWLEVALLCETERQSVEEAHMLPIMVVRAVADTRIRTRRQRVPVGGRGLERMRAGALNTPAMSAFG